jgi:hypothetical protein
VTPGTDGAVFTGNKAHRNGANGILTQSVTTLLAKNAADADAQTGIAAPSGAQDDGGNKARNGATNDCAPAIACK